MEYLDAPFDPDDPEIPSVFDEASLWSARFGQLMLDHMTMSPAPRRVLDLGCGCGFPLFEIAHRFGPGTRCTGVDLWRGGLLRAAGKRAIHRRTAVNLVRADGADLPFPGDTFDLVVSNVGINNFDRAARAIEECGRVTRPGGRIALTTNPRGHMASFYEHFRATLRAMGREARCARVDALEEHRATRGQVEELLAAGGFRPDRAVEDRMVMRFADGGALLRHSLIRFGFLDGWRSVLEPAEEAEGFAALEARLDDAARADGELRMEVPMLFLEAVREPAR